MSYMKKVSITKQGYDDLLKEQISLQKQRKITIGDLQKAREMGDLSENGFYKASKMRLGQIDHRLEELDYYIKTARVIENPKNGIVTIGTTVTLKTDKSTVTYTLVGELEANSLEGKISHLSPLGKAILNKKVGDIIEMNIRETKNTYTILKIQ